MVPFAHDPDRRWHLVRGDAAEQLALVPDHSVDCMIADVPYGVSDGGTTCQSGRRVSVDKAEWDAPMTPDESLRFHERWLEQARAALKPTGTLWVSGTHHVIFDVGFAMRRLGFHVLNLVTWCKPNASPHLAGRYFCHSTEQLIWCSPKRREPLRHFFAYTETKAENGGKQQRDYWVMPVKFSARERRWIHPTKKPEMLMERIIRATSQLGDLVVDPFCGSASSGAVAVRLGRRFLGIDLDPVYLTSAATRLKEETCA